MIPGTRLVLHALDRTAHIPHHGDRAEAIGVNHQTLRNWLDAADAGSEISIRTRTRGTLLAFLGMPPEAEPEFVSISLYKIVDAVTAGWPEGRDEVLAKVDGAIRILDGQHKLDKSDVKIWDAYLTGLGVTISSIGDINHDHPIDVDALLEVLGLPSRKPENLRALESEPTVSP